MYVQNGESCLHTACEHGYLSIVKHLGACGGEELLMLQNKVAVYTDVYEAHVIHIRQVFFVLVCLSCSLSLKVMGELGSA